MFTLWTLSFALSDSCEPAAMPPIWESNARKVERARRSFGDRDALETDVLNPCNAAQYVIGEGRAAAWTKEAQGIWLMLMPFDVVENSHTLARAVALWDTENAWRNEA